MNDLTSAIEEAGVQLDIIRPPSSTTDSHTPQLISLRHKKFGSEHTFQVASSTAGLVSNKSNVNVNVENGLDVIGEINGEETIGKGQMLTGSIGAGTTEVSRFVTQVKLYLLEGKRVRSPLYKTH